MTRRQQATAEVIPPNPAARRVQAVYYTLTLGNTLAASFIWGINTLFLLDAGLTNLEAFAANAFFSLGMFIFEIPTGVVADTLGRRASYLLGTVTLAVTTVLYWLLWVWESPFWAWAIVSMLLGLGFTFFSGAVDAWLVDALHATGYRGSLETVFGRAMIVGSIAMQFFPRRFTIELQGLYARFAPAAQAAAFGLGLLFVDALGPEGVAPFIYFQF